MQPFNLRSALSTMDRTTSSQKKGAEPTQASKKATNKHEKALENVMKEKPCIANP